MPFSGQRLRDLREKAGAGRKEVAAAAGTTERYVGHLETGAKDNPSLALVQKLAAFFGVTVDEFNVPEGTKIEPPKMGRPKKPPIIDPDSKFPQWTYVELVGTVGAGPGVDEPERRYTYVKVPARWVRDVETARAYRVRGDSMSDDDILDGDVVVVRTDPEAQPGDIVVAWVDSLDGCVVKKLAANPVSGAWEFRSSGGGRRTPIPRTARDVVYGVFKGSIDKNGEPVER